MKTAAPRFASAQSTAAPARFAYIGSHDALHVYKLTRHGWVKQQTVSATRPVAIAIANSHLYAANEVTHFRNLPCGSVQAFTIDLSTGLLQQKSQVALSLSATLPRDLAVAPDGRSLLVAAHGGGAYNLLPIAKDGSLGKVSGILKSVGAGPRPQQAAAHPAALVFDSAGLAIAADQGSDALHRLSLGNGALLNTGHHAVEPGSGPSALVLHPDGDRLYVANALAGTLSSYRYATATPLTLLHTVQSLSTREAASLAIHPAGHALYSAMGDAIQLWNLEQDGTLASRIKVHGRKAKKLLISAEGDELFALTGDAVVRLDIEPDSGVLHHPVEVVSMREPLSIALLA